MTKAQKPTKKELAQLRDLTEKLTDCTLRLTEIETEYEHYRAKTQTEMIELKDKKETAEQKLAAQLNYEELVAQLKEAQYNLAEKEEEIERVKTDCKEQLSKKQEEITTHMGQLAVKDEYIKELEE